MNDYISKPVNVDELGALLLRYLGALTAPPAGGVAGPAIPPAATEDPDLPTLDHAVLAVLRALDEPDQESLTDEVVRLYLEGAPEQYDRIEAAAQAGDAAKVRAEAHSLKSSSANVGAARVAAVCQDLERLIEAEMTRAPALVGRLRLELTRVYPALHGLIPASAAG
jgi:HPt (histidine-containing phosphotransfer) domain-containing protein